jgi:hypothetical protein
MDMETFQEHNIFALLYWLKQQRLYYHAKIVAIFSRSLRNP